MSRIDRTVAEIVQGARYPAPFDAPCRDRARARLGEAGGLTQFGVNALTLPPGAWSSQRHWHSHEDEFVLVLQGEIILVEEAGETVLKAGDAAAFPAGRADGHHLINRSDSEAVVLEVGGRDPARDTVTYSDIDMKVGPGDEPFRRKSDARPY
ncbi:MAG: cupin domain-containing protein [Alphaproteobacteria bacterium]|nr:cupin domain-containing protein [Alphaproteobacteria bacterium]